MVGNKGSRGRVRTKRGHNEKEGCGEKVPGLV
jgi:hypothetical protein